MAGTGQLALAAFVEGDLDLARAVREAWQRRLEEGLVGSPYWHIATHAWDLLREGAGVLSEQEQVGSGGMGGTPIQRYTERLPMGCIVLLLARPSGQQLVFASRHRGAQGLCGPDSVEFFAVPALAWAIQQLRPGVMVHVGNNAVAMGVGLLVG